MTNLPLLKVVLNPLTVIGYRRGKGEVPSCDEVNQMDIYYIKCEKEIPSIMFTYWI